LGVERMRMVSVMRARRTCRSGGRRVSMPLPVGESESESRGSRSPEMLVWRAAAAESSSSACAEAASAAWVRESLCERPSMLAAVSFSSAEESFSSSENMVVGFWVSES